MEAPKQKNPPAAKAKVRCDIAEQLHEELTGGTTVVMGEH